MKNRTKILLSTLSLLIASLYSQPLQAEPMRATENLREETVLLPQSAPDGRLLIPVAIVAIGSETEIAGILAFYDNPETNRNIDYVELYDATGDLLLIHWIDQLGITRTAVDRGLLRENESELEGILVLVTEGTAL